jgi:hypothetical protein
VIAKLERTVSATLCPSTFVSIYPVWITCAEDFAFIECKDISASLFVLQNVM